MALRQRTNAYWAKRANERLVESEKVSEKYRRQIRKLYAQTQRDTLEQLKKIYADYWTKEGGFDKQKLNLMTSSGDMNKFVTKLKKAGLYDEIPENYLGRINRLEFLNAQMWYEAHVAGQGQDKILTEANGKVYEDSYYRSVYDVSRGIGATPSFTTLDKQTINQVLGTKFDGKNYSERVWGNSDILANQLKDKLAQAIANGQSIQKTARDFRERFSVQNYYAERLIRTETNYFHNSAEIDSYKSMGFEYYEFLATLDSRTSEICQDMDGKRFKVLEGVPGDNMPPLHPNCRSTIVPYFKGYEPETRLYRDPNTGKNEYTYGINYNEWKKQFVDLDISRNGIEYNSHIVDKGDKKMISKSLNYAEKILNDLPTLRKRIIDDGGLEIRVANIGTAKGRSYTAKNLVELNAKFYANEKKYCSILAKEIKAGSKMRIPENYYGLYTITHEMGHVIENQIMKLDKSLGYVTIKNDIIEIAKNMSGKARVDLLKEMSTYGNSKPAEFFAEAFASYKLGGNNIWAKSMREYLKKWK